MKIKDLLKEGVDKLKTSGIKTPVTDAQILLAYVLNVPRWRIITDKDEDISQELAERYFVLIENRADREPLHYLINKKDFFGYEFYIERGVLIPRPETEILVEKTLEKIKDKQNLKGLEIGIGSGVISISLLKSRDDLIMTATDISSKAIRISKINSELLGVENRLNLIKSNLFDDLKSEKFDFIISNPPYISYNEYIELEEEVRKEPIEALISDKDGLYFYERIVKEGKEFLTDKGFFAFEIGYSQGKRVKRILELEGFSVTIYKDLQNLDRVVIGEKR
ncbi:peptide chain release factor N(5)-glutamine methyltransferase [Persephonella sp.]